MQGAMAGGISESGQLQFPGGFLPGQHFFAQQMRGLGEGVGPARPTAQHKAPVGFCVDFQFKALQIRFTPGMAQDHGQAQAQQLLDE